MKKKTEKIIKTGSKAPSFSSTNSLKKSLIYEEDFSQWAVDQAKLLKNREFEKLDMDHLIEELEDLSKREKQRLLSYLEVLLIHMLKIKYQPKKQTRSWELTIKEASHKVLKTLAENPSLKPKLKEILNDAYFSARLRAAIETKLDEEIFPEECPWKVKDILQRLEKKYC